MRRLMMRLGMVALLVSAIIVGVVLPMAWSLVRYNNPYPVDQDFAAADRGPALTAHVVLIVVDGLRRDAAQGMSSFSQPAGAASGAPWRRGTLTVSEPAYSLPTWAVIGTGTTQAVTGVAMNVRTGPAISNIFAKAKAAGLRTALVGGTSWDTLYFPWLDDKQVFAGDGDEHRVAATGAQMAADAALTLVYFPAADAAAHAHGARSPEYAAAVDRIDAAIGALLASLDLSDTTVILTADHGHVDNGGHGGPESAVATVPVAFVGVAVAPGPDLAASQIDLAPTVSALLGTGFPDFVQGRPLLDALVSDPVNRGLIYGAWAAQVEQGTTAVLPALGTTVRPIRDSDPEARAKAFLDQYAAALAAARAPDRDPLLLVIAAVIICAGGVMAWQLRRHTTTQCTLSAAAGIAVSAVAALIGPIRPSFSTLTSPTKVVLLLIAYSVVGMAVPVAAALIVGRRGKPIVSRHWVGAIVQTQVMVYTVALALLACRGPWFLSGYMPDFPLWLARILFAAYAVINGFASCFSIAAIQFIARRYARVVVDEPTRIGPAPGSLTDGANRQ